MTETRRAVPKGAALFIFLHADPLCTQAPPRRSSFSAARMAAGPCSGHLISSRTSIQRRTFPRIHARPFVTFPRDLRHGRRLQPEHLSRRPPAPCAHRCVSSQRDRHSEELATARAARRKVVPEDQASARLLHDRHGAGIRRSNVPSAFRGVKKQPAVFRRSACVHCRGTSAPPFNSVQVSGCARKPGCGCGRRESCGTAG